MCLLLSLPLEGIITRGDDTFRFVLGTEPEGDAERLNASHTTVSKRQSDLLVILELLIVVDSIQNYQKLQESILVEKLRGCKSTNLAPNML